MDNPIYFSLLIKLFIAMINFVANIQTIAQVIKANLAEIDTNILEAKCTGVSTDTRSIKEGDLFVALQGENFDGHNFIPQAIEKGAIAVVVNKDYNQKYNSVITLSVTNTLEAYQKIAQWWRSQLNIPIIGITGSVGKTTTKELLSAVLQNQGNVLKTEANYNNEIGVAKTLLEINGTHQYAVIEMAMRGKGEIALLCQIAKPDIAIITNVGTAHIGRLGSREAIAEAKCELLAEMNHKGVAILNADNELLIETAKKVWQGKTITYGLTNGNIQGELIDKKTLKVDGKLYPLPLAGEHNALNYLAAIAIAQVLNIDLSVLQKGVEVMMPKGRAKIHHLDNDIQLLDETYNAGFESMSAALKLLQQIEGKRKIAVLGTMKELGDFAPQLHQQVGEIVKKLNLDLLLVLADEDVTKCIIEGAQGIESQIFTSKEQLFEYLQGILKSGDRILFKASNSVGLSQIVDRFHN
jgi:UDP-N-acetylmuramoyl-tripeptide--D-alanyl-D-alanine ligase